MFNTNIVMRTMPLMDGGRGISCSRFCLGSPFVEYFYGGNRVLLIRLCRWRYGKSLNLHESWLLLLLDSLLLRGSWDLRGRCGFNR